MCGNFCGAARSGGAGFGDGYALASFDKSPLEPFAFKLVEPACFGQSARSGSRAFSAYDLDPGAYPGHLDSRLR
jgi:hypothetical protein